MKTGNANLKVIAFLYFIFNIYDWINNFINRPDIKSGVDNKNVKISMLFSFVAACNAVSINKSFTVSILLFSDDSEEEKGRICSITLK